ncbi:hypothetical protein CVIRNUC_004901 [Coccomyxa viridis]|uniref:Uncharacterized protein n=1 Tax=Coccomyxa viridis TaxID=1274662 RepID=A0AAV1I7C9_9CHLO|nr:hypothetical protein CVIRNUC_004901 [Coccomyxa viridis]
MRFFASSTRAIVGVLAALSCAAAQSFPNAQSIQVNTTGMDLGVLSKRARAPPPVPVPTPNPCLTIDPHCTSCSGGVCTACNIIFTLDNSTKKCVCPDGQQLAAGGTTCINLGLVSVGKALYNNTAVQNDLFKATENSIQHNKVVDSFVANTAKTAANFILGGQTAIKTGASKALAAAVAPIVQPAEFIAAPKEPQPEGAPAPDAALGAAVAGQPQPEAALAPKDAEYYKLAAEAQAQQAKEQQDTASKVLQAIAGPALAPGPAVAPSAAAVSSALQQIVAQRAAPAQQQASAAAGTPSGLNPISSLVSQAGGLLQSFLPQLGRRLLREQA